jgi:RHS repeat-associated protein
MTQAATSAQTLMFSYDQLSRNVSAGGPQGTVSYQYDLAGRRTRITWPDAFYAQYDYDLTGAVTAIRENGASSGLLVLASYEYDDLGRRTSVTRGNGVVTSYDYDAAGRLEDLAQNLASTANDVSFAFDHNAAGQAIERDRTTANSGYVWQQPANNVQNGSANGLNQIAQQNGTNFTYDGRGNLTSTTGTPTYQYDVYNRLISAGAATLNYDPAGRLYQTTSNGSTVTARFLYDGADIIAEYDASNALVRRHVHGPGVDEPIVDYSGGARRWLIQDQLGSVIASTFADGTLIGSPNTYDEYGVPGSANAGRFQYTGQIWLPEAQVYHYKARAYLPALGRFAQSDPILYAAGMNLYSYVLGDPINLIDPTGTRVYIGYRPVFGGAGVHTFVVVAPGPGQQPSAVFSYSPASANLLASAFGFTTLVPSSMSPTPTGEHDLKSWVNGTALYREVPNVSDEDAINAGNAVDLLVAAGGCAYNPTTVDGGCNSNGPPRAIMEFLGYSDMTHPAGFTAGWDSWFRFFNNSGGAGQIGGFTLECVSTPSGAERCQVESGGTIPRAPGNSVGGSASPSGRSGSVCRRMPRCPGGRG